MYTVVIGVRHKTAPIAVREKLAFGVQDIPDALQEMLTLPAIQEAAILSTCNRTEIYTTLSDTEIGIQSLKAFLNDYKGFNYHQHIEHAFMLLHEDAVMHLFRVASGLDSLVLGEGQIMAQVKEALKLSMASGASGELIDKIFKMALSVGKSVRSETGITNRDISVSRAAYDFVLTHHPNFLNGSIALIGAGKMAEILMAAIKEALPEGKRSQDQVVLVNRSPERVKALTHKYGFPGLGWDSLPEIVAQYETLFVATSSPHYVLKPDVFENINTGKVIVDISVPRNVDPLVAQYPYVTLYNTDDLTGYSGYSGENRIKLIHQAHQVIEREYQKYHQWLISRSATPVITQLRNYVEDIRRSEVAELEAFCPHVRKSCSVIDDLSRTLVNKILHNPTVRLKNTPELAEIYTQAEFLSRLFQHPNESVDCNNDTEAEPTQAPALSSSLKNVLSMNRARQSH